MRSIVVVRVLPLLSFAWGLRVQSQQKGGGASVNALVPPPFVSTFDFVGGPLAHHGCTRGVSSQDSQVLKGLRGQAADSSFQPHLRGIAAQ